MKLQLFAISIAEVVEGDDLARCWPMTSHRMRNLFRNSSFGGISVANFIAWYLLQFSLLYSSSFSTHLIDNVDRLRLLEAPTS